MCFCSLQDGFQEEELGPLSIMSQRDGPRVQTRDWKGSFAHARQEMFFKGNKGIISCMFFVGILFLEPPSNLARNLATTQ